MTQRRDNTQRSASAPAVMTPTVIDGDPVVSFGDSLAAAKANASAPFPNNSFGISGNRAAFRDSHVLNAMSRGDNEAAVFLWQLRNILRLSRTPQVADDALRFIVNVGTPVSDGKIYMVQMSHPLRCRIRIYYRASDNQWEFTIDQASVVLPDPAHSATEVQTPVISSARDVEF